MMDSQLLSAWQLHQAGRYADAARCYHELLARQPDHAEALHLFGVLHHQCGYFARAVELMGKAVALRPGATAYHANLAEAHRALGQHEQAIASCRTALLLQPNHPEARNHLGLALHDLGRYDEAVEQFRAFFQDAQGGYAEAAACLVEANALAQQQRRQQGHSYDPARHRRYIDELIAAFNPELFARLAGLGDPTRQPVFVVGMPRSGTTLVEQVLASHSRVHGAGELPLARQDLDSIPVLLDRQDQPIACLPVLEADHVRRLGQRHLEKLQALVPPPPPDGGGWPDRIVDKMPDNYLYLGLLALLFPNATFLHVRRDPRDVAVSCWMTNFRSIRWADDPESLASRIREHRRLMDHWQAVLPVPVHEVVYEQLVDDFETEARRLVALCGLEWEPACLSFHETKRPVKTASVTQVRQPLYRRSLARWKNYEAELAELFAAISLPRSQCTP